MNPAIEPRPFAFVLAVPDLKRTAAYFREALGFTIEWPADIGWHLATRGTARIMMGHCPDAMHPRKTGDHNYFGYLHVDDIDGLYAEWKARGAMLPHPPTDKPWGMREFQVDTPDGHRFMVGKELAKD